MTLKHLAKKPSFTIKAINGEYLSSSTTLEGLEVVSFSEDNNELLSLPTTFTR